MCIRDSVDSGNVGTDTFANGLSFSAGTLTLSRNNGLANLTTTIPLSGITGNFTDLDDTPANYSGAANKYVKVNASVNGLTFVTASTVGGDISYNDLQNLPSLFDGNYNSLSNQPTIPTNNNQLTNGAGYITSFTNTTYDLSVPNSTTKIRLSGTDSTDDDVEIAGGTNVTVTRDNANKLTISSTDTNTQLSKETVQDYIGEMLSGNTETRIAVTYDDNANKINFVVDDQSSDNNTTYGISAVDGDNSDEEKIRLTGNDSSTDDVVLEAGTGLSIARSGDKITLTNTDTGSGSNTL